MKPAVAPLWETMPIEPPWITGMGGCVVQIGTRSA